MTPIRPASALVIDDEAPALDELSYLLRTTFSITPVDAAQNSADALRHLQERHYDVVFLDVRMPGLNGIELGNVLRRFASPPAIVFVTAYEEYAVRAFDVGACDYLLKPVSRDRLRTALGRALGRPPERPPDEDDPSATIPVETAGRTRHRDRRRRLPGRDHRHHARRGARRLGRRAAGPARRLDGSAGLRGDDRDFPAHAGERAGQRGAGDAAHAPARGPQPLVRAG